MVHMADTNGIAVITQLQPIAVLFSIPEDFLPPVLKKLRANSHLPVVAYDRDGSDKLYQVHELQKRIHPTWVDLCERPGLPIYCQCFEPHPRR